MDGSHESWYTGTNNRDWLSFHRRATRVIFSRRLRGPNDPQASFEGSRVISFKVPPYSTFLPVALPFGVPAAPFSFADDTIPRPTYSIETEPTTRLRYEDNI